jgi:hypothetical protein
MVSISSRAILDIHSPFEKSLIERTMQQIKSRIKEGFDDYSLCQRMANCKLKHLKPWLKLFVDYYKKDLISLTLEPYLMSIILWKPVVINSIYMIYTI